MGIVGNAAAHAAPQQTPYRAPMQVQEKSTSVLDDAFKEVEPNTRYPKLWAPAIPAGEKEGLSAEYDVKVNLVKMLAPSVDKFNEEIKANPEDPIFVGVSFYKRETFILEVEVVSSTSAASPVGSIRTITTADKDEFGYYGKEVKAIICAAFGVDEPKQVDKGDVRAVAGKAQAALGKTFHVLVRNKIGRDTQRPFLQHQFTACVAQAPSVEGAA